MATVTRENIGLLNDKLTVKVNKEDYYPSFEKAIKDYSKKANIPGFRKGMVPTGVVKKMYGASVFYDEVVKVVEKELNQFLTNEKPEIFAQPLPLTADLKNLNMNEPKEYEFPFEIGLKPQIEIDTLNKATPTFYKVKVTYEMIDAEIERIQNRLGKMLEPETITSDDNVLNVNFTETDAEGNAVENGITKDNSLLLKYFSEEYRNQLMGKRKDESVILQLSKAFDNSPTGKEVKEKIIEDLGLDKENPAAAEKYFSMTITKIGLVEKREMNEEFFDEVFPAKDLKTENDFRDQIKQQIQQQWDAQSRAQLQDQLYHVLLNIPMQFPEEFLKRWMQRTSEKKKSAEEIEAEFPTFTNQLKWTLVSDKIINENNLEIQPNEIKENMRREVMQYFGQMNLNDDTSWIDSYIDQMMKDEKQVDSTYNRLITQKLFSWAESQVTPAEQELSAEEFTAMQHNHHH